MSITFRDFRTPGDVEAAVADSPVGLEYNEDDRSTGQNIRRPVMTAVTTYATRSLVVLAVVDGHRVEQTRLLLLNTQSNEVYSQFLATATNSHQVIAQKNKT